VKPENLFIKDDGDVVLGDFGLAGRKKSDAELLRTPCGTMTWVVVVADRVAVAGWQ
jgi:serine/threonine protein kinase